MTARFLAILLLLILPALSARAAEVYSNGAGGGNWSDVTTWRGGRLPAAEDLATITGRDVVNYDGGDNEAPVCAQLSIDPDGVLNIKADAGTPRRVLAVGGAIDVYGTLRLDGTTTAAGRIELRLAGPDAKARAIRVGKRGSLIVYGRPELPHDQRNVYLTTVGGKEEAKPHEGSIDAVNGTSVDLRSAAFNDLKVNVSEVDNTGFEPGEKINVDGCTFTGWSLLSFSSCDTATIVDNHFDNRPHSIGLAAIGVYYCSLADIRGNTIVGRYHMGIGIVHSPDVTVVDNTVEGVVMGLYWVGTNGMGRGNTLRKCDGALALTSMSGMVQKTVIEECPSSGYVAAADVQMADVTVVKPPEKALGLNVTHECKAILLNCPYTMEQIVMSGAAKGDGVAVQSMQYLIVGVKGARRPNMQVAVQTVGGDASKPDANVRNSPAAVQSNGMTGMPGSLQPLMVNGWRITQKGAREPAPSYTITVFEPTGDPQNPRKVLATTTIQPDASWYRPEPNAAAATIEIAVP